MWYFYYIEDDVSKTFELIKKSANTELKIISFSNNCEYQNISIDFTWFKFV